MTAQDHKNKRAAAKRYRDMGNSAFIDERYDDAITYYTQALSRDENDFVCYSNRSAAYLKKNELINALEDAGKCIAIQPKYNKGHIRRVAVYHTMEEFDDAISAYKEGLKHCPDDKTLQMGLKAATKKKERQAAMKPGKGKPLGSFRF